jgi:predicted molibdopterin-dependent oxidoreductase YjgC
VVVAVGQQFPGRRCPEAWDELANWSRSLEKSGRATVLLCVPNANSQGALDMGVYPGLEPGHRPGPTGLGTLEMLRSAAEGRIKFLWLMGADVLSDVPDAALAEAALRSGAYVVVQELFPTGTALTADVILPAAAFAEKEGSYTNLERRIQKTNPVVSAPGGARADWHVLLDVSARLGTPRVWTSAKEIAAEIARSVPSHQGFDWDLLGDPWSPVAGPADMPPELWHAAGESEPLPQQQASPTLPTPRNGSPHVPDRRLTTSWPLRWELRAVDATRRRGWVWPAKAAATGPNPPTGHPPTPKADTKQEAPAGALLLLAGRAIYDNGAMISRSPDLGVVTPAPFVELHPDEAAARGLAAGSEVTVSAASGVMGPAASVRVPLRTSTDTPPGAAAVLFDQPGMAANALMDSSAPATYVTVAP